jgi:hypothetical protein
LEAETANYWRFRHEHFRRDRPDLLSQIKRMNSAPRNSTASASAATTAAAATGSAAVVPITVASSSSATAAKPQASAAAAAVATVTDKAVTTEVQILKKRIEEMNKNLGELTAMVQKVNLKQEEQEKAEGAESADALPGTKRKKVESPLLIAEPALSGGGAVGMLVDLPGEYYRPEDAQQHAADLFPDGMVSSMDLDDDMPVMPMPEPMSVMNREREISDSTGVSDIEFVDQLLNAFGDESEGEAPSVAAVDAAFRNEEPVAVVVPVAAAASAPPQAAVVPEVTTSHNNKNLPDPELMQRLGEALMMLPKDIQEMIVDRLIQAITNPGFLQHNAAASGPSAVVPEMPEEEEEVKQPSKPSAAALSQEAAPTPLAAATLAALLHHYSAQMGSKKTVNKSGVATKTLPVIPVHA